MSVTSAAKLSSTLLAASAGFASAGPPTRHRTMVALARLVVDHAPPSALTQLALAERFLAGKAGPAELLEARQECWAQIGALACHCSISDSASVQAVMSCLEAEPERYSQESFVAQLLRVLDCDVPEARALEVLRTEALALRPNAHG